MSTFSGVIQPERLAAEITVKKMGIPTTDAIRIAAVMLLIPEALKETGRKVAADPTVRQLLVTDRTVAKTAVDSDSRIALGTIYSTYQIIKEFLEDRGSMYFLPTVAFATTAVDTTADTIALPYPNRVAKGDKVRFTTSGALPGGLSPGTDYFVKTVQTSLTAQSGTYCTITLAAAASNATTVDITSTGSGTHTLTVTETRDSPMVKQGGIYGGRQLEQFDRPLESLFRYYYIDGNVLQVLPAGVAGSVAFSAPRFPLYVSDMGSSAEIEAIFLNTLYEMAVQSPKAP